MHTQLEDAARHYYATVDNENPASVAALFTVDATYGRPGYEQMVGRAAILDFYSNDRVILAGRHTIHRLVCDGARVAVEGTFACELRGGSRVELGFSDFFVFREGLIAARCRYSPSQLSGPHSPRTTRRAYRAYRMLLVVGPIPLWSDLSAHR